MALTRPRFRSTTTAPSGAGVRAGLAVLAVAGATFTVAVGLTLSGLGPALPGLPTLAGSPLPQASQDVVDGGRLAEAEAAPAVPGTPTLFSLPVGVAAGADAGSDPAASGDADSVPSGQQSGDATASIGELSAGGTQDPVAIPIAPIDPTTPVPPATIPVDTTPATPTAPSSATTPTTGTPTTPTTGAGSVLPPLGSGSGSVKPGKGTSSGAQDDLDVIDEDGTDGATDEDTDEDSTVDESTDEDSTDDGVVDDDPRNGRGHGYGRGDRNGRDDRPGRPGRGWADRDHRDRDESSDVADAAAGAPAGAPVGAPVGAPAGAGQAADDQDAYDGDREAGRGHHGYGGRGRR